jgi:hypothetical protein
LNDAHRGLAFYERRRCVDCHIQEARNNRHYVRHGITCRQCHGGEPIASSSHFYSRLNVFRQHTHVCAKCHEGAGMSFALYVVHEPNPAQASTAGHADPVLRLLVHDRLAVGTFALFLPHTILWGIRELFTKKRGPRMNTEPKVRIKRFTVTQRLFHLVLMLTFLVQAATGLARMYTETSLGAGARQSLRRVSGLPDRPCLHGHLHDRRVCGACPLCPVHHQLAPVSIKFVRTRFTDAREKRLPDRPGSMCAGFSVCQSILPWTAGDTGKSSITGPSSGGLSFSAGPACCWPIRWSPATTFPDGA